MAFDFQITIPEDSSRWQIVQQIAEERHISPEQAIEEVFDAGIRAQTKGRKSRRIPDLEVAESMPIFGIFADKPEFSEAIDQVIASRAERYSKFA